MRANKYYTLYECTYCGSTYRDLDKCPNCGAPTAESKKLKTNIEEAQEKAAKLAIGTVELVLYRIACVLCGITFTGWILSPGMLIWEFIRRKIFKKKHDWFCIGYVIGLLIFLTFIICMINDTM